MAVEPDVEQGFAVGTPDHSAARVRHGLAQVFSGGQVTDLDGEELGPLLVDGVSEEAMVGAVGGGAQLPVGFALSFPIAVEQNLFRTAGAGSAAQTRILAARHVAYVIGIR